MVILPILKNIPYKRKITFYGIDIIFNKNNMQAKDLKFKYLWFCNSNQLRFIWPTNKVSMQDIRFNSGNLGNK